MMAKGGGYATFLVLSVLILAAGCAPTRSDYYSSLRRRRLESFRRWDEPSPTDERPRIEGELDLEEALRLALLYSPQLQAALQGKETARGRVVEAYSEVLPSADLSAGYVRLDQLPSMGGVGIGVGDLDNYSFRVTLTQPIFKGGAISIAQRAARLSSYLSDETVRGAVENVVESVARGYCDAVLAEELVAVQEDALQSARAHFEAVGLKQLQGVATEYDVLRARVDVSNIQADLIEQKRRRDIARASLLRGMGVSQKSRGELTTTLDYEEQEPPSFREAVRVAFQNRPDLYQAAISADLQQEALNEARTKYLPRLEGYYWHMWARPDPRSSAVWGRQWQAGLNLRWNLFDGLAREGRIIQQKALLRQMQILLGDAEQRALLEVKDALLELESARELVESQSLNSERASRALDLADEGYKEGVNTELEVLDATAALTRAKSLYYTALHRHTTARIRLQRAMGMLGPPAGTREVPERVGRPGDIKRLTDQVQQDQKIGQLQKGETE